MSVNEAKEAWLEELAAEVRKDPALLKDPRRCEALLCDLLPGAENRKKVSVLSLAVKEAIASQLEEDRTRGEKLEHSLTRRTKNFESATPLCAEMVEWSVRVWSVAIGWGENISTTVSGEQAVADNTTPSVEKNIIVHTMPVDFPHSGENSDLDAYLRSAERGSASSCLFLGDAYSEGRGVTRNDILAVEWYRKGSNLGNVKALNKLGEICENGRGVAQDEAKALECYRRAAEQGNAAAQCNLGRMYEDGRRVVKDDAKAVMWYRKAAEKGNAEAQFNLGRMYEDGCGVARDDAMVAKWYRKAAKQGNARAQYNLGRMYEKGRDMASAAEWYRKAAELGNTDAQVSLGRMYAHGRGVVR